MAKLISKTYGEALFELAVEEEKTDAMLEEIEGIKQILYRCERFELQVFFLPLRFVSFPAYLNCISYTAYLAIKGLLGIEPNMLVCGAYCCAA